MVAAVTATLCWLSVGNAQAQAGADITVTFTPYTVGTGANTKYFLSSNGTVKGVANTQYEKVTLLVEYYSVGTNGNPDTQVGEPVNMTLETTAAQQNWNAPGIELTAVPPAGQKFYAKATGTYKKPNPPGGNDQAGPKSSNHKEFP